MTEGYIQILIECMEKKLDVMDKIILLDEKQSKITAHQPLDMEAYDETMDEKGLLIEEITRLDDGFTSTFEMISEEVKENLDKYGEKVKILQELIRETVAKSATIETQEKRNRAALEIALRAKRQEIKQWNISSQAATKYYKAMSKINTIDPQLMDDKN